MDLAENKMYSGSCLCGAIQYEVSGPITSIIHCHCSVCRRACGTAYATNGFVQTSDFKLKTGADNLSSFSTKPGQPRFFCKTCGSPIYKSNDTDPTRIRLRIGTLTSDIEERPISHNFVTSKANWDAIESHLPQYESHEAGR